jgi:voltage-gated sodium channel
MRAQIIDFLARPSVQNTIIGLIVINAIVLGLETVPSVMATSAGPVLLGLDKLILSVFVAEIALRLYAHGGRFFRDPWSVFDFLVVGIAFVPTGGGLEVLRALRILRVLRLISMMPRLRMVVQALLDAVPGMFSIIGILVLMYYVAAVMATKLFGEAFPEWFGSIPATAYTLFQVMTLESWSMGIVRPVMEAYPFAWLFFVPWILVATFTMLNLFIAIMVNSIQSVQQMEAERTREVVTTSHAQTTRVLEGDLEVIRDEIRQLREVLEQTRRAG